MDKNGFNAQPAAAPAEAVRTPLRVRALAYSRNVFWFFVFPGAVTILMARAFLPSSSSFQGAWPHWFAQSELSNPIIACVLLFLVLFWLARYWSPYLPGYRLALPSRSTTPRLQRARLFFWLELALPLVMALALRQFLFQSYTIVGNSMLPTLESGDRVGTRPFAYRYSRAHASIDACAKLLRRGDVIILDNPTAEGEAHLVKRVIGLPGDQIGAQAGLPVINGWRVPTCDAGIYANLTKDFEPIRGHLLVEYLGDRAYLTLYDSTKPALQSLTTYTVKPGEVFVLGDNRNSSLDSRSWDNAIGAGVPVSRIRGRVDWFVAGTKRGATVDFSRFFTHIDAKPDLQGLDASLLTQRIQNCVANKPAQTWPPTHQSQSLVAQASIPM